ncbi:programmed cell death 6-interacting protein isoform X2 [Chrysoperla carnea]|uniref:programmed cell death 6-interacting protein isoform X2 n=1 Tax=Chrysoperla carnea TaxID=189513 RepID=UPI001D067BCC|nr:programmed cell death 6-interacting protein isoform X2 [Chrysoperla carnea]
MVELISVPLKKPTEVDIVKPLQNLIQSTYSTADKPQDYTESINELQKLRNTAIWRAFDRYESSLDVIYNYYDEISALEGKIPAHEVQIPFKWKDAFNKATLFGGRQSLTISSLSYERVCVLFNIAALQSAVAANQILDSDEGLKLAAKLFQQAAGIFYHLKNTVMSAVQQDPTPDLNPETLQALSSLMLAQAQEIFVVKSIHDNMKDGIIAKLCCQCEDMYVEVLKIFQKENLKVLWDREWLSLIAGKQGAYHALTEFYQSLVCKASKKVGEEITRLEQASQLLKTAQTRSGRTGFFDEFMSKIQRNLTEAKKDNDFIYHERIPDPKSLEPVGKAMLAKVISLPEKLGTNFKDLFGELVPVAIHQALATFDVRKNEIVNTEISRLRESTQLLNSILASLNLPAAIEDTEGTDLPQSLIEKANNVSSEGGISSLQNLITELPELLKRNRDILDECERLLNEEKESDDKLRSQFESRWTRTPSEKLTEMFKSNIAKYRQIINNAIEADKVVKTKYEMHLAGMQLLSKPISEIESAVPQSAGGGNVKDSSAVTTLRRLMEEVETIKAERDVIEHELKSATIDMKTKFLHALAQDGGVNETALSVESLGQLYGPLQKQVKASLAKQETLVSEIQAANTQFIRENGAGSSSRDTKMKELAAAHDAFIELKNNLKEGTTFYNNLTQLLVSFQNKISDFVFARKTEKEELLKDLTHESSRQSPGSAPTLPTHHTTDGTNAPSQPDNLPYPVNYQGMPIPYGASTQAPYPTYIPPPMPQGYNPYGTLPGTMPYPATYNYPGGFPQPPPGGVNPGYPGYSGGAGSNYPTQQPPHQQPPKW